MPNPLSKYFLGIGAKRLSLVEVRPEISNQHEFNGAGAFKQILGTERVSFNGKFIYLSDDEDEIIEEEGQLTWYDARENHPSRSEYRLYYSSNEVVKAAKASDLLVVAKTPSQELLVVIAPAGSTMEQQLIWLFGLNDVSSAFKVKDFQIHEQDIGYAGNYIISSLGIQIEETAPNFKDILINKFGLKFPKTREFSDFARATLTDVSAIEEPDTTLIRWIEREELLFRTLEREIVQVKLQEGFKDDVDEFISFSLSVQNRRKSRAGFALEHNLEVIFQQNGISHCRGVKTERNNRPDFLFPSAKDYHNPKFPAENLSMLGSKTTAKDRWRQVLSEANRIDQKHLITLEPAISKNQTDEMIAQNLQLVIPQPLMSTYQEAQQRGIINLEDFIELVKGRQALVS